MELDNDQKLAIVQNVISADNNYRLQLDQQIIQPRTAEIARNAINNNDPYALKLLPQDLRCQHADKILENLL